MSGEDCVHGFVITTEPPYGQSEKGKGGPSTGDGVPRNAGAASVEGSSFQSSAYAFANLWKKSPPVDVCDGATTAAAPASLDDGFAESNAVGVGEPSADADCAEARPLQMTAVNTRKSAKDLCSDIP